MNEEYTYGLKDSYIHAYMGDEARKQIPKWKKCEKNHNMNFNFPAFFFSFFWYFYKRAYKAGFVFLALIVLLPNIVGAAAGYVRIHDDIDMVTEYRNAESPEYTVNELFELQRSGSFDGTDEEFNALYQQAREYEELYYRANVVSGEFDFTFHIVFGVINMILHIIAAMFFDYFLFRKTEYSVLYEIAGIKTDEESAVLECLSMARESDKTKEKGLRTFLITAYVIYIAVQLFLV